MNYPEELLYTKDHEWASNENGVVTVGITHYAQNQLGDIVYVEFPSVGTEVKKGNSFGVVESVKAVSDLYSPISGKVVEINEALKSAPQTINSDPYNQGWMMKVRLNQESDLADLLNQGDYRKLIEE